MLEAFISSTKISSGSREPQGPGLPPNIYIYIYIISGVGTCQKCVCVCVCVGGGGWGQGGGGGTQTRNLCTFGKEPI